MLYGSKSSVSPTRRTVITQATTGIPGDPEAWDEFGRTVASADLDRDGYADLIVGIPEETVGAAELRGTVTVVWGGPDGLKGAPPSPRRRGTERAGPTAASACPWPPPT